MNTPQIHESGKHMTMLKLLTSCMSSYTLKKKVLQRFFRGSLRWSWCYIAPLQFKEPVKPSLVLQRFFSGSSVVLWGG